MSGPKIPDEHAKYIGGTITSTTTYSRKQLKGKIVRGMITLSEACTWVLVEDLARAAGTYSPAQYPRDRWTVYPDDESFDYKSARLSEIPFSDCEIEMPKQSAVTATTATKQKDIYAAGPEGETVGYLSGCTGYKYI